MNDEIKTVTSKELSFTNGINSTGIINTSDRNHGWGGMSVPYTPPIDQLRTREKAIDYTIQLFQEDEAETADLEEFSSLLDAVYQFLLNGTPLSVTINKSKIEDVEKD